VPFICHPIFSFPDSLAWWNGGPIYHPNIGQLPWLEERVANASEVKAWCNASHGRDRNFFGCLSTWNCSIPDRHGPKWGVVSNTDIIMCPVPDIVTRAKYPIAVANKLICMFRKNILFAYDIGCTFSATLSKSLIRDIVRETNFKCCTGSFHGAAHHRSCQLDFLIGLRKGAGIEDGKGNERLYSESNALAPIVCHASPYYRHLRIQIHFTKWDEIKYERLGM
jgi:hypothetical protein